MESKTVSFGEAFRFWLKLGFISFGGPAGQIALMHRELVEERRWIGEERFLHALNYCMLLPGPEAQQLATYVGWLFHRVPGGLVAGALFVIPSIGILLALSYVYAAYGHAQSVAAVVTGFKPVVMALVVEALLRMGRRALRDVPHVATAALAFLLMYFVHVPYPFVVIGAGLIGLLFPKGAPETGRVPRPSYRRALGTIAAGLALWTLPLLVLWAWRGGASLHVREYFFFSKAALVTFGGAYAVLGYVTQAAVDSYHWLTHAEAMDGLALAETTPGPLIMVLQFIGFLAAWNFPEGLTPVGSGVVGGLVTTYVTFLPSFVFILAGAPYVEFLRGNQRWTAALGGVTAAVVGIILSLALIFGKAVLFPQGVASSPDLPALLLAVLAFLVLYRLKVSAFWVVLAGGAVGVFRAWLGG